MTMRIEGGQVLDADGASLTSADVHIDGSFISRVGLSRPEDDSGNVIDARGLVVAPGLIDVQVNGGWGHDLSLQPEAVWDIGAALVSVGVTSWLPTLVSASPELMASALDVLRSGPPAGWNGAQPLGWHFEGPWLNPDRRGAHPISAMLSPPEGLELARSARLVTVAPELGGCLDFIESLSADGVVVSVGHSDATSVQVRSALDRGASMGTHLFNAMSGLHHRDPGLAAGLLDDERAWLGLIVDGHHVAPELVRIAWRIASERIVLVSDAMAAAGLGDCTSTLGAQVVTVKNGTARLADRTLAGSVITLLQGVHRLIDIVGCDVAHALRAATLAPAEVMRLCEKGRLDPGSDADLVLLNENLEVEATLVGGQVVYSTPAFSDRLDM